MINIIPKPVALEEKNGVFEVNEQTVVYAGAGAEGVAEQLAEYMHINIINDYVRGCIKLEIVDDLPFSSDEGYVLTVSATGVCIQGKQACGVFYGMQTLKQMMPAELHSKSIKEFNIPCVEITDFPRYRWRGMHLDVARHMFPLSMLKTYIDMLAFNKMNIFHWHLTEDQGWRIEIKKYPKLTEISSQRSASPLPADRDRLDGVPYGGYYTQEEAAEIVKYAAERFVTVVPEIELPGHTVEVLAAYPEFGCTGGPYDVRCFWGIEKDVYCAGNPKVFGFLEDVFDEVLSIFPSEYIHIGGDECPKDRWKECPKCQAAIKENNLKDEFELQSWFIQKVEKYLNSKGRKMIGWDEILEGGLAENATVTVWRRDGLAAAVEAAEKGNDVIMCPQAHCYFDHYQGRQEEEPPAIGGFLPLEKTYAFELIPENLSEDKRKHIIGGQANVWTEYIPTVEHLEYMSYPRAFALAEKLWSDESANDFENFRLRLRGVLKHLDELGVNYRKLTD